MRKQVATALLAACWISGLTLAAGPRGLPLRYLSGTDSGLQTVARTADGSALSVWAYRNGAEFDIAISRTDAAGRWTEPKFLGAGDGADQTEPALAVDAEGRVYMAYTDATIRGIRLVRLDEDGTPGSDPIVVRPRDSSSSFSAARLLVVEGRLIVAFRSGETTEILDLPREAFVGSGSLLTITESGDPVGYQPGIEQGAAAQGPVRLGMDDTRPVNISTPIPKKRVTGPY